LCEAGNNGNPRAVKPSQHRQFAARSGYVDPDRMAAPTNVLLMCRALHLVGSLFALDARDDERLAHTLARALGDGRRAHDVCETRAHAQSDAASMSVLRLLGGGRPRRVDVSLSLAAPRDVLFGEVIVFLF
jgi:hypothetical protein